MIGNVDTLDNKFWTLTITVKKYLKVSVSNTGN